MTRSRFQRGGAPLAAASLAAVVLLALAAPAGAQRAAQPAAPAQPQGTLAPTDSATTAPWMLGRAAWTSPRRAFAVGDIITVLVDERAIASANKGVSATDRRDRRMDVALRMPGAAGAPGSVMDGGFDSGNDAQSVQRGESVRRTGFRTEMSVRVVEVSATGMLRVAGQKSVNVDKDVQDITLGGWIRPTDVSPRNVVASERIADAQITYAATGSLGKPKGGIIGRVFGMIWP